MKGTHIKKTLEWAVLFFPAAIAIRSNNGLVVVVSAIVRKMYFYRYIDRFTKWAALYCVTGLFLRRMYEAARYRHEQHTILEIHCNLKVSKLNFLLNPSGKKIFCSKCEGGVLFTRGIFSLW